jgi:hypothetical protein
MSNSTNNGPIEPPTTTNKSMRDIVISTAQSEGDLVDRAMSSDPQLYSMLTGSYRKYAWFSVVVYLVTDLSAHVGLQLSNSVSTLIAAGLASVTLAIWQRMAPKAVKGPE